MKVSTTIVLAGAVLGANAGVASFTEDFNSGANDWRDGASAAPLEIGSGALDGSAFIRSNADLGSGGPFGLTVFRGQDEFGSSGNAFVGDYLAGGITTLSFDLRHDAGQDLDIGVRLSTPDNFPAFTIALDSLVSSGSWATYTFDISFFNPLLSISTMGPPTPEAFDEIASDIGHIQVFANRTDGQFTPLVTNFDLDNVSITPTPSSAVLLGLGGLVAGRRRR